jgi:hypothetical protein
MLVYVAVLRDPDLSVDQVLTVQTDRKQLEVFVKDYYGISETKKYDNPGTYLGWTKIEYSEFEDDLEGYYTFEDSGKMDKVFVYGKVLDENP